MTGDRVDAAIARLGIRVIRDAGELEPLADQAIADNPGVAARVRGGKTAAVGALVGAVMTATDGQADAGVVRQILLRRLAGGPSGATWQGPQLAATPPPAVPPCGSP